MPFESFPVRRRHARRCGLLYAIVAVSAPLGLFYVPAQLVAPGDAVATAAAIAAHPGLLRAGIASELFHQALEVFLVLGLVRLFEDVDRPLTRQMAVLGLLPIPMVFLNVLGELAALGLASGGPLGAAIEPASRASLAALAYQLHGQGLQLAEVFWGLWLLPLAALMARSGFVPKAIAAMTAMGGAGYLLDATGALVAPGLATLLHGVPVAMQLGEPVMILWLLVAGARSPGPNARAPLIPA